jgi:hypothetical protein
MTGYDLADEAPPNASYNTGIGLYAGTDLTVGYGNVLLGYRAGENLTSGAYNILIGYHIDAPAIGTGNYMSIGNLIFGSGIDGIGTTPSSGNIGIGIATPGTKLDVNGGVTASSFTATGYEFMVATSSTVTTATDACTARAIRYDADFIYVCVAANTWKRAALASWP